MIGIFDSDSDFVARRDADLARWRATVAHVLFKCRACGAVYRHGEAVVDNECGTPAEVARAIIDERGEQFGSVHHCSDAMVGVADFAGVEFARRDQSSNSTGSPDASAISRQ